MSWKGQSSHPGSHPGSHAGAKAASGNASSAGSGRSRPTPERLSERNGQALREGTRVDSFEMHDVLGSGSYGITYRAYDRDLERQVAIKEYFPAGLATRAGDATTLAPTSENESGAFDFGLRRFIKEARTLAQFTEPNIVQVLRYLETNGTGYLVMSYEDGRSLSRVVRRLRQLDERQARALAVHILRGLKAVHAKDFLHRDIKPSNILVRRNGPPVLLDFGAARLALEQQRTGALTVMLTPGYAPIEQYGREEQQGPWTDLYAMGATLYQCLVGRSPAHATDRLAAIEGGRLDPVAEGLTNLPAAYSQELRDTVRWMLAPIADQRPRCAQDVLDVLMPVRATGATAISVSRPQAAPAPPVWADRTVAHRPAATSSQAPAAAAPWPERTSQGYLDELERARAALRGAASASQAPALPPSARAAIAPAELERASQVLAWFVGPIAQVLVRRVATECASEAQFFETLALELDEEDERIQFLAKCGRGSGGAGGQRGFHAAPLTR